MRAHRLKMRHQIVLVVIIFMEILTTVTCSYRSEKRIKISNHQEDAMKTALHFLKGGDVDSASDEFEFFQNRDALVVQFVHLAFYKVPLQHIVAFVCSIDDENGHAANALYQQMAENYSLDEIETLALYYKAQSLANELVGNHYSRLSMMQLTEKLAPHQHRALVSLMRVIKRATTSEEFRRPLQILNLTNKFWKGSEHYLADLVNLYLSNSHLAQFTQLYDFVQSFNVEASECQALVAMWRGLKARGAGDTMEALAVWIRASEIAVEFYDDDIERCQYIANSPAPAFKHVLISRYRKFISNGNMSEIEELHSTYRMEYFLAEYISLLPLDELQNVKFNNLVDTIDELPFIDDVCFAAAAVSEKFKRYPQMHGSFEHFQILNVVMRTQTLPDYAKQSRIVKSKCESAAENTPRVFHKLLYGDTSNCSLINRFYRNEPLLSTNSLNLDELGHRKIYTRVPSKYSVDQTWNLTLAGWTHGIFIRNNQHRAVDLRYEGGRLRGSEEFLDLTLDYFRVHTKDDYILLQPTSAKVYVATTASLCERNMRYVSRLIGDPFEERWCVQVVSDTLDERAHWKLVCS